MAAVLVIFRGGYRWGDADGWTTLGPAQIAIAASPSLGDTKATQAMMVFSDFECQYCKAAADRLIPWLRSEYVDRGQLRLVLKHFPLDRLHKNARRLAQLSACASLQRDPWDVHKLLYSVSPGSSPTPDAIFQSVNLNARNLDQCAVGVGREIVEQDVEDAVRLGISSTPTFVIGTVTKEVIEARFRLSGLADQSVFVNKLRELQK